MDNKLIKKLLEYGGMLSILTKPSSVTDRMVVTRHYWIEILRIFLGGLLVYKGYYFVEDISEIYTLITVNMEVSPFILVHYIVLAHLVGGIMIMIGIFTRLAVLLQIPVLAGAVFLIHSREVFGGPASNFEFSLLVLVLLIVFFFYGAGKWSIDHHIARKKR